MKLTNKVRLTTGAQTLAMGLPGWVYFIEAERVALIKIGWSLNPETRFEQIALTAPYGLTLLTAKAGSKTDEAAYHARYQHLRVRGEWFKPDRSLRGLVSSLTNHYGPRPWPAPVYFTESEWAHEDAIRRGKSERVENLFQDEAA